LLNVCGCSLEAAGNALTVPDYLEARFVDRQRILRTVSSAVMLLFSPSTFPLALWVALCFRRVFEVNYSMALWASATVIVTYTFLGGFLAASWSDLIQGVMMAAALASVALMTWFLLSGDSAPAVSSSGDLASLGGFMEGMTLVGMLSVAGWAIGYCGQPHGYCAVYGSSQP